MPRFKRRSILALGLTAGMAGLVDCLPGLAQTSDASPEQRLRDLKIELPKFPPLPAGETVPYVQNGNLLFLAGLGPRNPDGSYVTGTLGRDRTVSQGYQDARLAGLRVLATLKDGLGSLDKVTRVVKILGLVHATPEFGDLGGVINGCSDLLFQVFGPRRGRHARTLFGVASLPFGLSVEIDAVVQVA